MKISLIKISNILGIKDMQFEPSTGFTEITGKNGKGKTSIMEAIKLLGSRGHDATLLRDGAEVGEVVYVLDDGTEIQKRITADKTEARVKVGGKVQTRPAEFIRSLVNQVSSNPVDLIRADDKTRVKTLLEALPIELDNPKLEAISGVKINPVHDGVHPLIVIEDVRRTVYDLRTGTNRLIRDKDGAISQTRQLMPDVSEADIGGEDEVQIQIDAIRSENETERKRINTKLDGLRVKRDNDVNDHSLKAEAEINRLQALIDAERMERDASIQAARDTFDDWKSKADTALADVNQDETEALAPLQEKLAAMRGNRELATKRTLAAQQIATMEDELDLLKKESEEQTAAIAAIDKYKLSLMTSLPISGLEVRDDAVYLNGIVFSRLNAQQQVDIAMEVAKLRAGKLGIMCLDNLELMDTEHYEALRQRVEKSSLQFFATRVSDSPLTIS